MDDLLLEPLPPIYDPAFNDSERTEIEKAHRWAYHSIYLVLDCFASAPLLSRFWEYYTQYMEYTDVRSVYQKKTQYRSTVERNFRKMALLMCETHIHYLKRDNCPKDWVAMAVMVKEGAETQPITICPRFFNSLGLAWSEVARPDWIRALLVVHEISHAIGGGTSDIDQSYSDYAAWRLAYYDPAKAVQNAQNYAYLAMNNNQSAPGPERPHPDKPHLEVFDPGYWEHKRVGGNGPPCSNGPAAAMIVEDVLMLVYPTGPYGMLYFKTLDLHEGREVWSDAIQLNWAGYMISNVCSVTAPALTVADDTIYCAYGEVDGVDVQLKYVAAKTGSTARGSGLAPYTPKRWANLQWGMPVNIAKISAAKKSAAFSLVGFRSGESWGLYCVYRGDGGILKSVVQFPDTSEEFKPIGFDQPWPPISNPALVVYAGRLRCAFLEVVDDKKRFRVLTYRPAETGAAHSTDIATGTWHLDSNLDFGPLTNIHTLALAEWYPHGKSLMALGKGWGDDHRLYYCGTLPLGRSQWLPSEQMRMCRTKFSSALVPHGTGLHAFHQHEDESVEWMTLHGLYKR